MSKIILNLFYNELQKYGDLRNTQEIYNGKSYIIKLLLEGGQGIKRARLRGSLRSGKYGHLTIDAKRRKGKNHLLKYLTMCDCGIERYLNVGNIQMRADLNAGCLSPSCKYGTLSVLVWTNPEVALWLQLSEILYNCPEDVSYRWGGLLGGKEEPLPILEGFNNFKEDIMPMVDVGSGKWWIVLSNPDSLFTMENICRTSTNPDSSVFKSKDLKVGLYGVSTSLPELSQALKFDLNKAYELRKLIVSVDQYIDKLID